MPKKIKLPKSICKFGYPESQITEIFGNGTYNFYHWMTGKTYTSCDAKVYNHEKKQYEDSDCGPHGFVYYVSDVERHVRSLTVVD